MHLFGSILFVFTTNLRHLNNRDNNFAKYINPETKRPPYTRYFVELARYLLGFSLEES